MSDPLSVEATGETVGEAKWSALRELEQLAPGLDKAAVQFEVLSEGERGLLGVGYAPARVVASVDASAVAEAQPPEAPGDGEQRHIGRECRVFRSRADVAADDEVVPGVGVAPTMCWARPGGHVGS